MRVVRGQPGGLLSGMFHEPASPAGFAAARVAKVSGRRVFRVVAAGSHRSAPDERVAAPSTTRRSNQRRSRTALIALSSPLRPYGFCSTSTLRSSMPQTCATSAGCPEA